MLGFSYYFHSGAISLFGNQPNHHSGSSAKKFVFFLKSEKKMINQILLISFKSEFLSFILSIPPSLSLSFFPLNPSRFFFLCFFFFLSF